MQESSGNGQHKRLVKLAVEEFFRKLRGKGSVHSPGTEDAGAESAPRSQVVVSEPIYGEPKLGTIPRSLQKCFICGEMPISGVLMPTSVVLYFCERHLSSGRALADSAWEAQKEKERLKELYELWQAWRQRLLDKLVSSVERELAEEFPSLYCENCGDPTMNVLTTEDGSEVVICPDCAISLGYKSREDRSDSE